MASDDTTPEDRPGTDPTEGIRIISPDEVDKVADRDDVARRRRADEPKYGDRPASPPDDARPTIRFPLPDAADPRDIARPRPAPVERPTADDPRSGRTIRGEWADQSPEPAAHVADDQLSDEPADEDDWAPSFDAPDPADDTEPTDGHERWEPAPYPGEVPGHEDAPAPPELPDPGQTWEPRLTPTFPDVDPDLGGGEATQAFAAIDADIEADAELLSSDDPAVVAEGAPPAAAPTPPLPAPPAPPGEVTHVVLGDEPVLDLGPSTGETQLPHWTEPPTGEVPRIIAVEDLEVDPDEDARWSDYATPGGPRWRDEHDTGGHAELAADLAAMSEPDDDTRLGALDTTDRTSDEAYLNFDDVEFAPEPERERGGRRGRRGRRRPVESPTAGDPIDFTSPALDRPAAATGPLPLTPLVDLEPIGADPGSLPPPPAPPTPDDAVPPARPAATAPVTVGSTPTPSPTSPPAGDDRSRRSRPPRPPQGPPAGDTGFPNDIDPAAPRPRRRPAREQPAGSGSGGRDVTQAAIVGVAIAAVALVAFRIGPAAAMVIVTVVVALAGAEFFSAMQRSGFRPATLLGLVAVGVFPLTAYWRGEAAFPLILFLTIIVGFLWYLLGVGGKARPTANLGVTLVGVVWVGGLGAFAALILDIPAQGVSILVVTVVAAVAADVGGFFVGRAMGRTPLIAASPNKTVEGLVGGVLGTLIAVFVVAVLLGIGPFSAGQALVFGLLLALAAPLGDLSESLLKRDLGLKDMGSLLPEHGGILDRFDGMLFVLPTAYYVTRAFGLVG